MALRSWTPDKGFISEKVKQPASVSTSLSLEICSFPATLGSSVAAAALEQLLVVEKSLQGDYFTCNEEVKTFLKNIIVAVKKLEEMRKKTVELLEIESMELSRLYFLLETVPNSINRELEECVRDARRFNIFELNQMRIKVERMDNEVEFLKKEILDLQEVNEALGVKQAELAKQHAKFVLMLNQTLEEKATATIYINDTYTRINFEREEILLQKQCLWEANELMERHKVEYLEKKNELAAQMKEFKQSCEARRKETYSKKKELTRLQNRIIKMKQTVTTSTVMLSDHSLEMSRLQESLTIWERKVEDMKRVCTSLEEKLSFFQSHREVLDGTSTLKKTGYLNKIQQLGEKLHKAEMENTELRETLHSLIRQYKMVTEEEDKVHFQKQKVYDENQKLMALINQKENFLAQRKLDIKNMEEGFETLQNLHEATKEVYRKQVKILSDNLEKELQRSVITQWKIVCARKRHTRWLLKIKVAMRKIITKIEESEERRTELLKETKQREEEIRSFVKEIEKLKLKLVEEEKEFVKKEKKLMKELSKYEDLIIREVQINKEKEEELEDTIPYLQVAEEEYKEKNRNLKSLHSDISAKKQEENLLNNYIFRFRKDIIRYMDNTDSLKTELKHLRDIESKKTKEHFEILKNLENEVYVNDQKATLLILENKKLREHLAYLKKQTQIYIEKQQTTVQESGNLSWQLIAQHKFGEDPPPVLWTFSVWGLKPSKDLYLSSKLRWLSTCLGELPARTPSHGLHTSLLELVTTGEDTLQEIKTLIEKLQYRDKRIEAISAWLLGSIERLRLLMLEESPSELRHNQYSDKFEKKPKAGKKVHFPRSIRLRRNALTRSSK
ncbi:coiled-coil domain-containing protein 175 [Microtus ochrogaster]|uniref:Coiled-coil domain-containing protein 175 n=1 Tax=Microtus ochrogaster TaxID=79684 RepID=A0ABM1ALE2_MICOH|nr:coiled-coil domain-containing protein 175 [Microtus ochrogaster]